jgi:tagatose-1,6-bisphosphate aldolase
VLLVRLAKNHPLPDGNKRAAWVSLRMFVAINRWSWRTRPAIDDAETKADDGLSPGSSVLVTPTVATKQSSTRDIESSTSMLATAEATMLGAAHHLHKPVTWGFVPWVRIAR